MNLDNCTPEELFNMYKEVDQKMKQSCTDEVYQQLCNDRKLIAQTLREEGYVVAYHPNSGNFLCPV